MLLEGQLYDRHRGYMGPDTVPDAIIDNYY